MKRLISHLLLASCALGIAQSSWTSASQALPLQSPRIMEQPQLPNGLYYSFYGQQVPLTVRQDTIAVAFKPTTNHTRGTRGGANLPLHLQLQQDLQGGTRGEATGTAAPIEVKPLGQNFALVTVPTGGTRGGAESLSQTIKQQSYVEGTLPVLSRSDRDEKMILQNEIVLGFEPGTSESQKNAVLLNNNLEIVHAQRFTGNRYLVRSTATSGIGVLNLANRLNNVSGVRYATPNFVQSVSYQIR